MKNIQSTTYVKNIVTIVKNDYLILIPAISLSLAIPILGILGFQHTALGQTLFFENLSKDFPPNSINAVRYRAIAKAISEGKKTYTFNAPKLPPIASK